MDKRVLIGCAAGGATDSPQALKQLVKVPDLRYVILDFLSENLMGRGAGSVMGRMATTSNADPDSGFSAEFLYEHLVPNLATIHEHGLKVVTNAGAINPRGLARAVEAAAREQGFEIKVAAVEGDDVLDEIPDLTSEGFREMFSGEEMPSDIVSAQAYLGAFPIAAALARGADMVVTGRVADSGMALGPLIHEFGWGPEDFDLLAAGTLAGHVLECGSQSTGGTFTDWRDVPGWENMGYPVAEIEADGSFTLTKPDGTGGLVSVGTVSEQTLYEVSDPRAYIVPDVVCDFTGVKVEQVGPDRVRVSGARGRPATHFYKVCATYDDGWRTVSMTPILGIDAELKAERRAEALFARTRRLLEERGFEDWRLAYTEVIGTEVSYGRRSRVENPREVISKIVVEHPEREAAEMFFREERASQLNLSVGTGSGLGPFFTAPKLQAVSRLFSFLLPKDRLTARVWIGDEGIEVPIYSGQDFDPKTLPEPEGLEDGENSTDADATVPLVDLAWGRSGDKGDLFNVAVIARDPAYLPYIRSALTPEAVGEWYLDIFNDPENRWVERFEVPGINALNFVVHESMYGGVASGAPILDRSAKGRAQQLLEFPVKVPASIVAAGG